MVLKRIMILKVLALVLVVGVLPACPTGGGPLSIDVLRYWPMAVGNYWTFESKFDSDDQFVYTVVQDLSTARNPAWAIREDRYDDGQLSQTFTQYFIWRDDFLVRTSSRDKALLVLAQPDISAYGLAVEIELPRYTLPSASPRLFKDVEPGERLYTISGKLGEIFGLYECADDPGAGLPYEGPVPEETPAILRLIDDVCEAQSVIDGSDLFARGVGPVDVFAGRLIDYAVVNN